MEYRVSFKFNRQRYVQTMATLVSTAYGPIHVGINFVVPGLW